MPSSIASIIYVLLGSIVLAIFCLFLISIKLDRKVRKFTSGKDGQSLEATIGWLSTKSASVDETLDMHKKALELLDHRVGRSIRGYSLIRYNAYSDTGGTQSFASGLLDEHQDGYVLSVITNRNHVGIYAKKVNRGISDTSLTEEEEHALEEAKKSLKS